MLVVNVLTMKIKEHYNLIFFLILSYLLTIIGVETRKALIETDVAMLFLLINLVSGLFLKPRDAYLIFVINICAFHYFILPEFNSFKFQSAHYLVTYVTLALSGIFVVQLSQSQRKELHKNHQLTHELETRNALAQHFLAQTTSEQIADAAVTFLAKQYQIQSAIFTIQPHWHCLAKTDQFDNAWLNDCLQTQPPTSLSYLWFSHDNKALGALVIEQHQATKIDAWFLSLVSLSLARTNAILAQSQAETNHQVEQVRSTLLASVSHDLKTPLGAIIGSATTLCDDKLQLKEELKQELLHSIAAQSERLNQSLTKLLDITRYTATDLVLNREWLEPEELLGSARQELHTLLSSHQVHISGPPMLVELDALLMEQVLCNLLENAAKYSPAKSDIHIAYQHNDGHFVLTIANPCTALAEEELEKIFSRFYRIDNKHVEGTGLGLAICKVIVEAHDGIIHADNLTGYGIQFTLSIPCGRFDLQKYNNDEQ
ncbi:osmosensitive K+ channel histidine kinase KdpD [Vibrio ponticus]|nr:osmosensitive K+ channel histidine kinase KdpD [Vibrio ponticus]